MSSTPEPTLPFPGSFSLYVMGKNEDAFEDFIYTLLRNHLPDLQLTDLSTRLSKDGNYISVKAVLSIETKEQIDKIYLDLYEHKRVLMSL
jgi:putative lipoic acid-binding regulatory protein